MSGNTGNQLLDFWKTYLNWWKVWTAGRLVQQPDSCTTKPSCWIDKIDRIGLASGIQCWDGSMCCFKTCIYLSILFYMFTIATNSIMSPHTIWDTVLITSRMVPLLFSAKEVKRKPNFNSSGHRTVYHFARVHFKWAWLGEDSISGLSLHIASSLNHRV